MKAKAKFIVSLFIAAATAITISAFKLSSESCSVTGKITDNCNKDALALVAVELLDASRKSIAGPITDFDSSYTINSSAAGTFNIRASFVGYKQSVKKGITLSAGKNTVVDFDLEKSEL